MKLIALPWEIISEEGWGWSVFTGLRRYVRRCAVTKGNIIVISKFKSSPTYHLCYIETDHLAIHKSLKQAKLGGDTLLEGLGWTLLNDQKLICMI